MRNKRKNNFGFSFLEVMIALGLLSSGMVLWMQKTSSETDFHRDMRLEYYAQLYKKTIQNILSNENNCRHLLNNPNEIYDENFEGNKLRYTANQPLPGEVTFVGAALVDDIDPNVIEPPSADPDDLATYDRRLALTFAKDNKVKTVYSPAVHTFHSDPSLVNCRVLPHDLPSLGGANQVSIDAEEACEFIGGTFLQDPVNRCINIEKTVHSQNYNTDDRFSFKGKTSEPDADPVPGFQAEPGEKEARFHFRLGDGQPQPLSFPLGGALPPPATFGIGVFDSSYPNSRLVNGFSDGFAFGQNVNSVTKAIVAIGRDTGGGPNNGGGAYDDGGVALGRGHRTSKTTVWSDRCEAVAIGYNNRASNSTIIGWNSSNNFNADCGTIIGGVNAEARTSYSTAMGLGTIAEAVGQFVMGKYNIVRATDHPTIITPPYHDDDVMMIVGWGTGDADRSNIMEVKANGLVSVGARETTSDKRLKKDITDLEQVKYKMRRLKGFLYRLKANQKMHLGLIADQVQEEFPELVQVQQNGLKTLDYRSFTFLLIKYFQELQKELKSLKNVIEEELK